MGEQISRRLFLKGGLATAAGLAASSIPGAAAAAEPDEGKQLATLLDIRKCKGKGKPHLKPVEDTMARANNLAAAMIVAPIAGIAAAVGKFYKRTK